MSRITKVLITVLVVAMITVIGVVTESITVVDAGSRGIVTYFGAVEPLVLTEGFHWKNPLARVTKISVRTQTISFDGTNTLGAASKDLQDVSISFVVNYRPNVDKVNTIFQTFGLFYEENILNPIIRETVKTFSAQYTAEELVTKRSEVSSAIEGALKERFEAKMMALENASIVNFSFSDSFNSAIEAKVTAEQNALAAKNKLDQVQFEAQQTVAKAEAEAESIRIQGEALRNSPDLVRLKAVQTWNGVLPTYMMGDTIPFLSLK